MVTTLRFACCVGLLAATTACHGDCYTLRSANTSGRFRDTLVAVSGDGKEPGTVQVLIYERRYADHTGRYAGVNLNASGILDTVSLYRMTLVSDPARAVLVTGTLSQNVAPGTLYQSFNPDSVTFERLFVHLATEDVLFELVAKNGTVVKALLNLEERQGPKEACEPWT